MISFSDQMLCSHMQMRQILNHDRLGHVNEIDCQVYELMWYSTQSTLVCPKPKFHFWLPKLYCFLGFLFSEFFLGFSISE